MTDTISRRLSRDAMEFAPGLLAIQESPPAKWPRVVMFVIFLLFVSLLLWAVFGKLDVIASASGRLVPRSYVKIVQPAEEGIVREILVEEGDRVRQGQVLLRMDTEIADAEARTQRTELALAGLQLRRIDAELGGTPMVAERGDPPRLYAQVESQFRAHRQTYFDELGREKAVLNKARFDLAAAEAVLGKLQRVVPMYRTEAEAMERLAGEGHAGSLAAAQRQREAVEKAQDLRAQAATVASLKSAIEASEKQRAQITSSYISRLRNERVDTELRYRRLQQALAKSEYRTNLLVLRAPQAGVVNDLATHTPGTVVSPGKVLLALVPYNEPLRAEVKIKNRDVGFVHEGQRVKVKLAPYPFQKYGMLEGTVTHIGPDAAANDPPSPRSRGNGQPLVEPFYKALVELDSQVLLADGHTLALAAGMQVAAEIHLGERTVMEYLLSPVRRGWQEAGRER